ncbi:MAG: hypothetical protein H7070_06950, partial [Saprospiraceae bacterium]|nr:hypothetical protein [Pyrinomonadaceae bacterium]
MKKLILTLALAYVFALSTAAQQTGSGTVAGTVTDNSGAAIAAADLRLVNSQQIVLGATKSDGQGR